MKKKIQIFLIAYLILFSAIVLSTGCISPQSIIPANYTPTATSSKPYPTEQMPVSTLVVERRIIAPTPISIDTQFTRYTNSKYGFSIDYPANWEKHEIDKDLSTTEPGSRVVIFSSPSIIRCNSKNIECVKVNSEITVDVDNYPFTKSLEDYYIKDVAAITSASGIEITRSQSLIKLSGAKAYSLDYNTGSGTDVISVLRAYTIIGDKAYIITYHSHFPKGNEVNQFELYYNDVDYMRKSFTATGTLSIL